VQFLPLLLLSRPSSQHRSVSPQPNLRTWLARAPSDSTHALGNNKKFSFRRVFSSCPSNLTCEPGRFRSRSFFFFGLFCVSPSVQKLRPFSLHFFFCMSGTGVIACKGNSKGYGRDPLMYGHVLAREGGGHIALQTHTTPTTPSSLNPSLAVATPTRCELFARTLRTVGSIVLWLAFLVEDAPAFHRCKISCDGPWNKLRPCGRKSDTASASCLTQIEVVGWEISHAWLLKGAETW